jgi:hypothetical protein
VESHITALFGGFLFMSLHRDKIINACLEILLILSRMSALPGILSRTQAKAGPAGTQALRSLCPQSIGQELPLAHPEQEFEGFFLRDSSKATGAGLIDHTN